jgi:hypothetical protein
MAEMTEVADCDDSSWRVVRWWIELHVFLDSDV